MVVSYHVCAGSQTQVLCKNKCVKLLSSPQVKKNFETQQLTKKRERKLSVALFLMCKYSERNAFSLWYTAHICNSQLGEAEAEQVSCWKLKASTNPNRTQRCSPRACGVLPGDLGSSCCTCQSGSTTLKMTNRRSLFIVLLVFTKPPHASSIDLEILCQARKVKLHSLCLHRVTHFRALIVSLWWVSSTRGLLDILVNLSPMLHFR